MITNNTSILQVHNRTEEWNVHPPLSRTVGIILAAVMLVTLLIGFIGNTVVLCLFIKYKSLRTASNIFIASLTVTDLLMCVCHLPILINNYFLEQVDQRVETFFCYFDTFIGAFTGFGAIWSLTALAIDRCVVITRTIPVRYARDDVCAYIATGFIWIVSFAFAAMPFIGFGQYVLDGSRISCTFDYFTKSQSNMLYNVLIQVLYFCIPIVCMLVCYGRIFVKVRTHERRYFSVRKNGDFDVTSFRRMRKSRKLERNELKTAKAGIILISVFCLSWAPYSIVSWIGLFGTRYMLTPLAVVLPAVFAKVSTILNPLLYALLLRSFKVKLRLYCNQHFKSIHSSFASTERTHMDIVYIPAYSVSRRNIVQL